MRQDIEATFPLVSLSNKTARREILISPILTRVARDCHCQLRIEYPLTVSDRLKGNLDYWLRGQQQCVVIEAKNDDLTRGFAQLAIALIALAEWTDTSSTLYSAVTIGDLWIFGTLDPLQAQIVQDINRYKIPGDLETLVSILVGILEGDRPNETTQSAVL